MVALIETPTSDVINIPPFIFKNAWASPGGNHRNTRWIPRRKREKELLFAALRGSIMG